MSDRVCIRGCTKRDLHYASCLRRPPEYTGDDVCHGCAPRECREGSLICDRCFGRMRRLLDDAPDLVARLWSLVDPTKATPLDQVRVRVSSSEPVDAVAANPLDARIAVQQVLADWLAWRGDLAALSNDKAAVEWFGPRVLDRHKPVNGIREAWSVQDAVDQWGVERVPAKGEKPWEPDEEREEIVTPVREWGEDSIVGREEAEGLAGSPSTLRRWVKNGDVQVVGEIYIAGIRTRLFRRVELTACRERMEARMRSGSADQS